MSQPAPQRAPIHPDIDETLIDALVGAFYAQVRTDALLGPIFERTIGDDWDRHLDRMKDFWSSVMLMTGRYKGTPLQAHQRIGGLEPGHFEHWLALWHSTARDVCPSEEAARLFIDRAERIATSIRYGVSAMPPGPQADTARRPSHAG